MYYNHDPEHTAKDATVMNDPISTTNPARMVTETWVANKHMQQQKTVTSDEMGQMWNCPHRLKLTA